MDKEENCGYALLILEFFSWQKAASLCSAVIISCFLAKKMVVLCIAKARC